MGKSISVFVLGFLCLLKVSEAQTEGIIRQPNLVPLAVGNTWTYDKTVPEGKRAFFQRLLPLKDGGGFVTVGVGLNGPSSCTETYRVMEPGPESGFWVIHITSVSPACTTSTHGFRDGRYEDADKVLWATVSASNKELAGRVLEKIIYDRKRLPPGWKDKVVEPVEAVYDMGVLWHVLPPEGKCFFKAKIGEPGSDNSTLSISDCVVSLTTPAGHFKHCVEVLEDVAIAKGKDMKSPWETGWTTIRYFCHEIGLVKELQKNRAGEILYTMELTKYEVR